MMKTDLFTTISTALLLLTAMVSSQAAEQLKLAGLTAQKPADWITEPPKSSMRLAQFRVPGDAELVVFYFGPKQGGTPQANIARWQSQFSTTDGSPVKPVVRRYSSNSLTVTQAEFQGIYARGVGTGPIGEPRPDQILLAAIIEGPQGKLFVQLYGHGKGVNAQRSEFESFVLSMRSL